VFIRTELTSEILHLNRCEDEKPLRNDGVQQKLGDPVCSLFRHGLRNTKKERRRSFSCIPLPVFAGCVQRIQLADDLGPQGKSLRSRDRIRRRSGRSSRKEDGSEGDLALQVVVEVERCGGYGDE
jgi:hypothetical protein